MKKFFFFIFFIFSFSSFSQSVIRDETFNQGGVGTQEYSAIYEVVVQPDGKILLAGQIFSYNGVAAWRIIRLNNDGSLDNDFNANVGSGPNQSVTCITLDSSGKIYIGGPFTTFNGSPANYLVRLHPNGTIDTTFTSNIVLESPYTYGNLINSIVLTSDNKLLVAGKFWAQNYSQRHCMVKLNIDGSLDDSFTYNGTFPFEITKVHIDIDGSILVGLKTYSVASAIKRLNPDGSVIPMMSSPIADFTVNDFHVQPDGKIVVVGDFSDGQTIVSRINPNGTMDPSFAWFTASGTPNFADAIHAYNGKYLVAGKFATYAGSPINSIMLLNTDGTLDDSFNAGSGIGTGYYYALDVQDDGKIIAAGTFISFNGQPCNSLVRLIDTNLKSDSFIHNNTILAYPFENQIRFISSSIINSITLYDLSGRVVYLQDNVSALISDLPLLPKNQILVAIINTETGLRRIKLVH